MKMVLVRCRAVETLFTSLKFTKHTLEGTILESLQKEKARHVYVCANIAPLLVWEESQVLNVAQVAEQLGHLLLGGLGGNVGHLDDCRAAHLAC